MILALKSVVGLSIFRMPSPISRAARNGTATSAGPSVCDELKRGHFTGGPRVGRRFRTICSAASVFSCEMVWVAVRDF